MERKPVTQTYPTAPGVAGLCSRSTAVDVRPAMEHSVVQAVDSTKWTRKPERLTAAEDGQLCCG